MKENNRRRSILLSLTTFYSRFICHGDVHLGVFVWVTWLPDWFSIFSSWDQERKEGNLTSSRIFLCLSRYSSWWSYTDCHRFLERIQGSIPFVLFFLFTIEFLAAESNADLRNWLIQNWKVIFLSPCYTQWWSFYHFIQWRNLILVTCVTKPLLQLYWCLWLEISIHQRKKSI